MKNILENLPIDESNFLEFDIKKLRKLSLQVNYQSAIDRLSDIRATLLVAKRLGRLSMIGNRSYYIDALRWLKGEAQLVNWYNVPQITSIETISPDIAQAFDQYTQSLLQNIQTEQIYSQIELAMEAVPVIKAAPMSKRVEKIVKQAEAQFGEYKEAGRLEIESISKVFEGNTANMLQAYRTELNQTIEQVRNEAIGQLSNEKNQAIAQLQAAVALEDWGRNYDKDINELQRRLYGRAWDGVAMRNFRTVRQKLTNLRSLELKSIKWFSLLGKTIYLIIKNAISLLSLLLSRCVFSLAARRVWSYLSLITISLVMVIMPILSIIGWIHSSIFNPSEPLQWVSKVLLFLPAVIMLSIGYSFTTKNYRIYSNMLDQYRHRRAVARTAQGIILNAGSSDEGKDIRQAMTTAAAVALFEHKITGHLSKKEIESLGLLDILRTVGK